MGKQPDKECMEFECSELSRPYVDEATKNIMCAFTEGYLLGRRHAKLVFGKETSDEDKSESA